MVPGSVLMMPRGTWHYTEAEQDSMAISIVLSPPTQIEYLLSGLKSTLLQSPAWRSPCYGISGKADAVSKLYSNLSNTIYKLTKNYQNPNSPLRSFHKNSRYLCNPGTEIQVTPGETVSQVEYQGVNKEGIPGTIRMEVPRDIASVLHSMTTRNGPFTVGECMKDFPGVSQDDFRELFSRAEGTGLLRKLWFVDL